MNKLSTNLCQIIILICNFVFVCVLQMLSEAPRRDPLFYYLSVEKENVFVSKIYLMKN